MIAYYDISMPPDLPVESNAMRLAMTVTNAKIASKEFL
eukprot:SAG31_NODE_932_length_10913_cov_3.933235_7_plen_38_part_00